MVFRQFSVGNHSVVNSSSKNNLFWGHLAQLLNVSSGLILLPIALIYLNQDELGIWFIFSSLSGLAQLIELGFQPTIARYVAYSYAGCDEIDEFGVSRASENSNINIDLLCRVYFASKNIYTYMTYILVILLVVIGSGYLYTINADTIKFQNILIAWILYSCGFIINFYFGFINGLLQGRGDITQSNQAIVINRIFMVATSWIFLHLNFGLVGLGLASIISTGIGRFALYKLCWIDKNKENYELRKSGHTVDKKILNILMSNAFRLGWVNIGAFLITRMNQLIASSFLGLKIAASYGLTYQILAVIANVASTFHTIKIPLINFKQAKGSDKNSAIIFGHTLCVALILYLIGSSSILLFGNLLLTILKSKTYFLAYGQFAILMVTIFLELNTSLCSSFLLTYNRVPFVRASIISGVLVVILSILNITYLNFGIWGIILSQLIVQISYNNWKWPMEAAKKMNANYFDFIRISFIDLVKNQKK